MYRNQKKTIYRRMNKTRKKNKINKHKQVKQLSIINLIILKQLYLTNSKLFFEKLMNKADIYTKNK